MVTKNITTKNLRVITESWTGLEHCLNTYSRCEHGCLYCYSRVLRGRIIPHEEWVNPAPKVDLLKKLGRDMQTIQDNGIEFRDIMVSSTTDCYQPLELKLGLTRSAIEMLVQNGLPFTVLTKNPNVLRDIDLFKGYDNCRVGFTIITLDDELRKKLEPNASPIEDRIEGMKVLKGEGITTHCSVEPIMPCAESDPIQIIERLGQYVDLFEFGMWNPKLNANKELMREAAGIEFDKDFYADMFPKLISYCEKNEVHYCMASHSEKFLRGLGLKFIPTQLVTNRPYPSPNDDSAKV
ncbi:MAG: radical SAM protein [Planctomycetes bacterium]|nr:radical SAM protein [Planctomycetota bacterium]